ncbi:MAG: sigma-70 family RNA polymerase sigma factor [Planctomycetales bacterium]|nr:sigma-70 family RNA polymerase sigma factor [Planctomycetales bacterium]
MAPPAKLDSSPSSSDAMRTSASLLDRARHRDDLAWNELVELYAPLVYFWCRKTNIVEQDIPDVVQEVFRAVVTGIGGFRKDRPGDTFRGWLRIVTRSKLADHFRRLDRNPIAVGGSGAQWRMEHISGESGDCDSIESEDDERLAEFALFHRGLEKIRADFDPKTWQAFWRVVVDGLSASEAGHELGMRPGTVRVAKSRVLQRLRRQLGDVE